MRPFLFGFVALLATVIPFDAHAVTLGADCGPGSVFVAGYGSNDDAGKFIAGSGVNEAPYSCTVTFAHTRRACSAMLQSRFNGDGPTPTPLGALVADDRKSVLINGSSSYTEPIVEGDVVTYLCQ